MKLTLDLNKTVEQNAAIYFEKSKKNKRKIEGILKAINKAKLNLEKISKKQFKEAEILKSKQEQKVKVKKEWYHKFRWFISSEDYLCIGGRDATSNEIIIKKHADTDDLVFHTDMAGSPFFVIKTDGKMPGEQTIKETADATCSFSRAWKLGLSSSSVFYVKPEQLSKTPNTGEYIQKGSFIVRGKTNYVENKINCAVGMAKDNHIMAGPLEAVKKHCKKFVILEPAKEKASATAKKIKKKIGGELDDIIRVMPSGGCGIKK